jgi:hypothetical protein
MLVAVPQDDWWRIQEFCAARQSRSDSLSQLIRELVFSALTIGRIELG